MGNQKYAVVIKSGNKYRVVSQHRLKAKANAAAKKHTPQGIVRKRQY